MKQTTLTQALSRRRTVREFSERQIPLDALKRLIWAAQGITAEGGKRTAPSAHSLHPIKLLCLPGRVEGLGVGVYQADPYDLTFTSIDSIDRRESLRTASIDTPRWITEAACIVAVCGDMVGPNRAFADQRPFGSRGSRYVYLEAGAAAQNLHLQAAADGLGCVWVGGFDDEATADILGLCTSFSPIILMCVGYPSVDSE